jgi:hypothetical protein
VRSSRSTRIADRLARWRHPRRDGDTTSASAHPELLAGELAMQPRFHPLLNPEDQIAISKWRWRTSTATLLFIVAVITWLHTSRHFDHGMAANASGRSNDPSCIAWDARASEAIAIFVQSSNHDIDLTRVSYMIDKMRSARRNCQLGLPTPACENYRTVVREAAQSFAKISDVSIDCEPAVTDDLEASLGIVTPGKPGL